LHLVCDGFGYINLYPQVPKNDIFTKSHLITVEFRQNICHAVFRNPELYERTET